MSESVKDIVREMRKRFKPYARSESNDARYTAYMGYAEFADRIEKAHEREVGVSKSETTTKENLAVGNNAKMREALRKINKIASYYDDSAPNRKKLIAEICDLARIALAEPQRNCDRLDGDINFLREACLRERGLNPEEDFPKVFCEWLLEPAKEEERIKILKILTKAKGGAE